jgi:hypothetical protein
MLQQKFRTSCNKDSRVLDITKHSDFTMLLLSNFLHNSFLNSFSYFPNLFAIYDAKTIQNDPFDKSQKESKTCRKESTLLCDMETCWGTVGQSSDTFCMERFLCWQAAQRLPWTLNHGLLYIFLPVPVTQSSACVRRSQTIFQEHVVPFHTVPMWRDVMTMVQASKRSLGPCNTRKFRIPYNALCSLLLCDRHVCPSYASAATRLNCL